MFSLLRADLRRIVRRHGSFYGFVIALFVFGLFTGAIPVLVRSLLASVAQSSGGNAETQALNEALSGSYASPTGCIVGIMMEGGFLTLIACLSAAHLCWVDKRNGFDRTIVSSCGKRTYYHEKMAFALVLSVLYAVVASVFALVIGGLISGIAGMDTVPAFLGWFVCTVLVNWACACLCMAVLWLFKSQVLVYLLAFVMASPVVMGLLGLGINNLGQQASELYNELCRWLPHTAVGLAGSLVDGSFAFPVEDLPHLIVPCVACLALTFVGIGVLRKRDL